jgi:two-component system response regulator AlgR
MVHRAASTAKHHTVNCASPRTLISANWQGTLHVVPLAKIRYFRAEHKYVTAHYPEGMMLLEESLAALAEEFKERFLRVHRSALVALAHIQSVERAADGRQYVRLDGVEDRILVSRRLHASVRKMLKLKRLHTIQAPFS